MKRLIPFALATACALLLCQIGFSEGASRSRPARREVAPRTGEARKLTQRLRELNAELREATAAARRNENIRKISEKLRTLQENLRDAQQKARDAVDKVIVKENPDLASKVKERREIETKLRELRGGPARRGRGAAGPSRPRPSRPQPQAEEAPQPELEKAPLGTLVHFDIPADDPARAREFYSGLFEWKIEKAPGPMEYWLIAPTNEEAVSGGLMKRPQPEQRITPYFAVPSIDEYVAKAEKLGGKIVVPKMPVTGMGYFAFCLDTENNVFAMWETNPDAQ
jgi:predicted enzyme related to lactoylglutathione lyase